MKLNRSYFSILIAITVMFAFSGFICGDDDDTAAVPTYTLSGTFSKANTDTTTTGVWYVWLTLAGQDYSGSGDLYRTNGTGYASGTPVNYSIPGIAAGTYRITAVIYDDETSPGPAQNGDDWLTVVDNVVINSDTTQNLTAPLCTNCE